MFVMGMTGILGLWANALVPKYTAAWTLSSAFYKSLVAFSLLFAFQVDDLDSGMQNDVWFLVIAAILVIGVVYIYRGPRKT